jgi:hypothetical protein
MIFTNLHPKYDVQYVGGDALRKSMKLPLGIRVILNVHNLGSFFKFESRWFFDSLKDLLEPFVINKIMRTGGSLRGLK